MDGWKMSFLLGNPIFRCELLVSGRVYFWFQTSKWHLTAFVEVTSATVLNSHREIHHNVTEQLSAQELVAWTWVKNSILRVSLGQGLWFQMETKDCTQTIIGEAKKVMLTAIWVFFRTGMGALITSHFLAWNASHSNFHTLCICLWKPNISWSLLSQMTRFHFVWLILQPPWKWEANCFWGVPNPRHPGSIGENPAGRRCSWWRCVVVDDHDNDDFDNVDDDYYCVVLLLLVVSIIIINLLIIINYY